MNIPEFTAQASLYRTSNSYRSLAFDRASLQRTVLVPQIGGPDFEGYWNCVNDCRDKHPNLTPKDAAKLCVRSCRDPGGTSPGSGSVYGYHPGQSTQYRCNKCLQTCAYDQSNCEDYALAASWTPFGPLLWALCSSDAADCRDQCATGLGPCCPKTCGPRSPFDPSAGCCDGNEQCVGIYDPNSRQGCCPSDQIVCDGKCCAAGENFCRAGLFCERQFIGDFPNTPPPPPPVNNCIFGGEPCGNKCCPPGLQCCGVFNGQPDCRTSCVH